VKPPFYVILILALAVTGAITFGLSKLTDERDRELAPWHASCKKSDECWTWFKTCCTHKSMMDCKWIGKELFP
jgi:hypothetical protein